MPIEIQLPAVAPDVEQATVEEWHKQVGDDVSVGDVLVDVSTDKAVVEVEAESAGRLARILVEAGGSEIAVGTPIAVLLAPGEEDDALESWAPGETDTPTPETVAPNETVATRTETESRTQSRGNRFPVSPVARRIAARQGFDLEGVEGSGPKGRIVLGDVVAAAKRRGVDLSTRSEPDTALVESVPATPNDKDTTRPADRVRRIIADRLTAAKRDIPHFYLFADCEVDRLIDLRTQLNSSSADAPRVSVNDLVVRAIALALREVPEANCAWSDGNITQFGDIDVAVAVAGPNGLMTPVLRRVDQQSLTQLSTSIRELAERARAGRLAPDEFKGGAVTVSNLGMHGVQRFSAIINPPQSCIVAVGAAEKRPVVRDDRLAVATVMSCTLSLDHRVIDGALGATLLGAFRSYIENPVRMVL